jgi:cytochrome b6-f complex iron-sulfur subunit
MERHEFLKTLGISFAVACAGSCLASCGGKDTSTPSNNPNPIPPPTGGGTGSTVSANLSNLTTVGSSTKVGGVLFFRIATGDTSSSFVATEAICPHQAGNLNWVQNQNKIICDLHASTYQQNGTVISQPVGGGSTRTLKIYNTSVNATSVVATIS